MSKKTGNRNSGCRVNVGAAMRRPPCTIRKQILICRGDDGVPIISLPPVGKVDFPENACVVPRRQAHRLAGFAEGETATAQIEDLRRGTVERRMRSSTLIQRIFQQRRVTKCQGTSSDPLRGPPSPKGKAFGYRISSTNSDLSSCWRNSQG